MKDIKLVAMDFYYNCPAWLTEDRSIEIVKITGRCTEHEVDALLYGLFGFNDIPIQDTPGDSIKLLIEEMRQEEVAFSGGLFFQEGDMIIMPGCCCGLEQWREVVSDILAKGKPWMGHDPWGTCLYEGDKTIVCSDDMELSKKQENDIIKLVFENDELNEYFKQLEADMKDFIYGPLQRRMMELTPQVTDEFCKAWENAFNS